MEEDRAQKEGEALLSSSVIVDSFGMAAGMMLLLGAASRSRLFFAGVSHVKVEQQMPFLFRTGQKEHTERLKSEMDEGLGRASSELLEGMKIVEQQGRHCGRAGFFVVYRCRSAPPPTSQ